MAKQSKSLAREMHTFKPYVYIAYSIAMLFTSSIDVVNRQEFHLNFATTFTFSSIRLYYF
jgi:hypothetical protein